MEAKQIKTAEDAQTFLEGCVNDLENGLMTKAEFMNEMAEYTSKIVEMTRKATLTNKTRDIKPILKKAFNAGRDHQMKLGDPSFEEWFNYNYPV